MTRDNRLSAALDAAAVETIGASLLTVREQLPFLISITPPERRDMPKLGEKSVGFDEKCVTYMQSNPEFLPGFVDIAEVDKDRALRTQMLRFAADLQSLAQQVEDTLTVLGSEIWMADLAYYQSAREAARRGRAGAQGIYEDLRSRFPGGGGAAAATPSAATEAA